MSNLLNKRLARSLWRTKIRLVAVVLMVFDGVVLGCDDEDWYEEEEEQDD